MNSKIDRTARERASRTSRIPDAVQRLFALRRRAGTYSSLNKVAPDQQRTTPQERRAARHPGNAPASRLSNDNPGASLANPPAYARARAAVRYAHLTSVKGPSRNAEYPTLSISNKGMI